MAMAEITQAPSLSLERDIISWCDSVYDEAERELNDSREIRLTSRLIDYISGQQWTAKARFGRSRPTVNRIFRHFVEMAGLLTDLEPDFQVKFLHEGEDYDKLTDLLNEMIGLWARMTDFEMELTMSVMWALVCTGWMKAQWDPTMNNGMGDCRVIPLGPLHVMTIGAGDKVQDDECVIARWPVTVESLFRTFGPIAREVNPDVDTGSGGTDYARPGKLSQASWARLNPQLRRLMGVRQVNQARQTRYPRVMLKQFWFKDASLNETSMTQQIGDTRFNWSYKVEPGMPLYPRGRFIIAAGGKVLQDWPNPYWHAMFPFAKLRLIRVPWSPHGASAMEPLALMSDVINRINGGIMDMIRAAIEPKIVAPKSAFSQSVWDSLDPGAPGAKLMYNNNTPRPPEYPRPPELPAYVLVMKQDVEKEQDASSGASAIGQAMQKKQVPGGDSLEMILNSRSIPIRFMGRGIYSFCTEIGTMVTAMKLQFENAKSRVAKFGAKGLVDGDWEPYYGQFLEKGMEPEDFVKWAIFEIRKGSLLAIEKQDEVQVGFVLRRMGDISRRALLRKLGLSNAQIEKIEGELLVEAQQKIALAGAAGQLAGHGKK